jgi:hypothetical protein
MQTMSVVPHQVLQNVSGGFVSGDVLLSVDELGLERGKETFADGIILSSLLCDSYSS